MSLVSDMGIYLYKTTLCFLFHQWQHNNLLNPRWWEWEWFTKSHNCRMIPRPCLAWIHLATYLQFSKSLKTRISIMMLDPSFVLISYKIGSIKNFFFPTNEKWAPSKAPVYPIWVFLFLDPIYPYWGKIPTKYLLYLQCLPHYIIYFLYCFVLYIFILMQWKIIS